MLCVVGAVGRGLEAQSSRMFSGDLSALGWLEQGSGGVGGRNDVGELGRGLSDPGGPRVPRLC